MVDLGTLPLNHARHKVSHLLAVFVLGQAPVAAFVKLVHDGGQEGLAGLLEDLSTVVSLRPVEWTGDSLRTGRKSGY